LFFEISTHLDPDLETQTRFDADGAHLERSVRSFGSFHLHIVILKPTVMTMLMIRTTGIPLDRQVAAEVLMRSALGIATRDDFDFAHDDPMNHTLTATVELNGSALDPKLDLLSQIGHALFRLVPDKNEIECGFHGKKAPHWRMTNPRPVFPV